MFKNDCINEKAIAHHIESTVNSSNSQWANIITKPLIKSRNIPKVNTVSGIVNKTKSGLRNVFSNAKTKATIIAAIKPET